MLWWAFDPVTAKVRGATGKSLEKITRLDDPCKNYVGKPAVVLIDEIDKADPDVPNNLLVPLGSYQFQVTQTKTVIKAENSPLVIITTNQERELPAAFLRRCVEVELDYPYGDRLVDIVNAHFHNKIEEETLYKILQDLGIPKQKPKDEDKKETHDISQAEFIDLVQARLDLKIKENSTAWKRLLEIVIYKHGRRKKGGA